MLRIRAPAVTPPSNAGIPGRRVKIQCAAGQRSLQLEKSAHSSEDPAQSKKREHKCRIIGPHCLPLESELLDAPDDSKHLYTGVLESTDYTSFEVIF